MKAHKSHAGVPSCHRNECWFRWWLNNPGKLAAVIKLWDIKGKEFCISKFGAKYVKHFRRYIDADVKARKEGSFAEFVERYTK